MAPTNQTAERCVEIRRDIPDPGAAQEGWYRGSRRFPPLRPQTVRTRERACHGRRASLRRLEQRLLPKGVHRVTRFRSSVCHCRRDHRGHVRPDALERAHSPDRLERPAGLGTGRLSGRHHRAARQRLQPQYAAAGPARPGRYGPDPGRDPRDPGHGHTAEAAAQAGRGPSLLARQDPRPPLPAPEHPDPGLTSKQAWPNSAVRRSSSASTICR